MVPAGVHMDRVRRRVQNIVSRTGHLHKGIGPLGQPGDGVAAIHPDGVDVLGILKDIEHGKEGVSGVCILLVDFNSCQRVIAEGDVNRPLAVIVDGLHLVAGEIPLRRADLIDFVAAGEQLPHGGSAVPPGGDGVVVGLVDAFNAVGGTGQRLVGPAVPLRDGDGAALTRGGRITSGLVVNDNFSRLIIIKKALSPTDAGCSVDGPLTFWINADISTFSGCGVISNLIL